MTHKLLLQKSQKLMNCPRLSKSMTLPRVRLLFFILRYLFSSSFTSCRTLEWTVSCCILILRTFYQGTGTKSFALPATARPENVPTLVPDRNHLQSNPPLTLHSLIWFIGDVKISTEQLWEVFRLQVKTESLTSTLREKAQLHFFSVAHLEE